MYATIVWCILKCPFSVLYLRLHYTLPPLPLVGEDVEELETTVFEFEPGITDAPLPALTTVIEDSVLEDERESFSVEIVSVSEGVIGEVSTATVIIPDDDSECSLLFVISAIILGHDGIMPENLSIMLCCNSRVVILYP